MAEGNILRVVSPGDLQARETQQQALAIEAEQAQVPELSGLASFVRTEWETFRLHRSSENINDRLLHALATFNGQYGSAKLQEIQQFGGSTVYSRLTAVKCRGATSLLRDVYLGGERPWGLEATPDPNTPDDITGQVVALVQQEAQTLQQGGQPVTDDMMRRRLQDLMKAAEQATIKQARKEAAVSEEKVDDYLVEGGFYEALMEFLVDLPLFPYAVMKGPVVRFAPDVVWENGKAVSTDKPRMFWERVSPFDIYWTPGVSNIGDAAVIERLRLTRADLNALLGVPGYDEEAIRAALDDYGRSGLTEYWDDTDSERSDLESREDTHFNRSRLIDGVEYHGAVQGHLLRDFGLSEDLIPDLTTDYFVQVWIVGRHVIKAQLNPNPRKRHPYYITSFEKVPGTIMGNGLTDILADIQDVANASLRALTNNLSISSGPQVVIIDDRMGPTEDTDSLFPWKRWHVQSDPMGSNVAPVTFFQPQSNSQELLGVYQAFTQIADDISAIPRYITGAGATGGAGRTASGLAMLMNNASKILQTVAANVDRDILGPLLAHLYDMLMLTDQTGMMRGDENIRVRGVAVATQRETDRMRQIEFLQATMNPVDMSIMGPKGRATILRSVSETIGLDGEKVIPSEQEMEAQMQAQQQGQLDAAAGAGEGQGDQAPRGGQGAPEGENMTQTRDNPGAVEQRQRPPQGRV